jgi:hypothetical protein
LLEDDLLHFAFPCSSLGIVNKEVVQYSLAVVDVCINFSRVSQVPHPSMMGENWSHPVVFFSNPRLAVNVNLAKLDLVYNVLVVCVSSRVFRPILFANSILRHRLNLNLTILQYDILNVNFQESIERADLLRHQSMLLKVSLDDSPSIVAVNRPVLIY